MTILIEKAARRLTAERDGQRFCCRVALGRHPVGHKQCEGDGKTPEGEYYICLKRETGKFGCALGISYPSALDARQSVHDGRLPADLLPLFEAAQSAQPKAALGNLPGRRNLHSRRRKRAGLDGRLHRPERRRYGCAFCYGARRRYGAHHSVAL